MKFSYLMNPTSRRGRRDTILFVYDDMGFGWQPQRAADLIEKWCVGRYTAIDDDLKRARS